MMPKIHESCFVADNATIIGDVEIAEGCGIWYGAVIRGDLNPIRIGKGSNIQDNCVIHVSEENGVEIGENVSVGHLAMVHGAKIGNNVIIGINATVLDGAEIGDNSIIGANALVTSGMKVPPNSLVLGVPGKVVKTDESGEKFREMCLENAKTYHRLRDEHKAGKHEIWKKG